MPSVPISIASLNKTQEFEEFIQLCGDIGAHSDLVQGGGGNISVKIEDEMLIKPSGSTFFDLYLGKISPSNLDWKLIKEDLFKGKKLESWDKYTFDWGTPRASLEFGFHSLTKKYTVHIHPMAAIAAMETCPEKIKKLWPDAPIIDYVKPGEDLAAKLAPYCDIETKVLPELVFLKNHGVIISGDDSSEVRAAALHISKHCEEMIGLTSYKVQYEIDEIVDKVFYESEKRPYIKWHDGFIPFSNSCPDFIVYMGPAPFRYKYDSVIHYQEYYGTLPTIIYGEYGTYIAGKDFQKCCEIEEIIRANNYVNLFNTKSLTQDEIGELLNWDAEKYRKEK